MFIAQLESPPPEIHALEEALLRKVAPGPGEWAQPADVFRPLAPVAARAGLGFAGPGARAAGVPEEHTSTAQLWGDGLLVVG